MKKIIEMITISLLVTLISGCIFNNTYKVTFVMGGERENITYDVKSQNTITEIPDTTYENYIFLGWYTDSEFNNKFDFTKSITQDTTIYARYSIYELGKENYIAFEENNKWGFMLPTGEIIVEGKYDHVEPFRYGYALVVEDEQFSFIDTLGNEMSQWFEYSAIPYYGTLQFTLDGLAKVYVEKNVTKIINTEGNTEFQTTLFIPFDAYYENDLIPAYLYDGDSNRSDTCVYLDRSGDIALQNNYRECSSFNDGLAKVKIDSRTVFINTDGEIVLDDNYNTFTIMFDGIKPVYFNEGYAIVKTYASLVGDTNLPKYKIIDQQGNVVAEFDPYIETPVYVTNEYILTKNNDEQVAIYNFSGEKVLDYQYYACNYSGWGIFDDLVVVMNSDGDYGVVEVSNGDLSIDFQYDFISGFKDGYAVAEQNDYYGVINEDNQVIVNFEYSELESSYHIFINEEI